MTLSIMSGTVQTIGDGRGNFGHDRVERQGREFALRRQSPRVQGGEYPLPAAITANSAHETC